MMMMESNHPSPATAAANHTLTTSSSSSSASINLKQECFVVQRCWFSGPDIHQPVDYLRLFDNRKDAEAAAFHSAHAWARARAKSPHDAAVKTLLLPSNPTSNSAPTASYGFVAQGSLFWVRPLVATHVVDTSSSLGSGGAGGGAMQPQQQLSLYNNNNMSYAVVTEGVIGGTGNRNSRRGTEVQEGRVFCGSSRFAHILALQVCHAVMATLPDKGCTTYVASMAMGRPEEYESARFLQEWPPQVGRYMAMDHTAVVGKRGNYCLAPLQNQLSSHYQQPSHPLAAMVESTFANNTFSDSENHNGGSIMAGFRNYVKTNIDSYDDSNNDNNDNHNHNNNTSSFPQIQQGSTKRRRMDRPFWQTNGGAPGGADDEMVMG
jgi:hypothetical protein